MEIAKSDLIKQFDTPVRFLFGREDKTFLRLLWFNYDRFKDEFYMGSSLNPIISPGKSDVCDVIFSENNFHIEVDNISEKRRFNSLKFSFHSSGIRLLRMKDLELSTKEKPHYEQLYREQYAKLDDLESPEMLFAMVSKKISSYADYRKHLNEGNTSAVLLNTPTNYLQYRQVLEFYICKSPKETTPNFIIKKGTHFQDLTFKLKDNLYLCVKFVINTANSQLNSKYPNKEILFFTDKGKLKTFSFE